SPGKPEIEVPESNLRPLRNQNRIVLSLRPLRLCVKLLFCCPGHNNLSQQSEQHTRKPRNPSASLQSNELLARQDAADGIHVRPTGRGFKPDPTWFNVIRRGPWPWVTKISGLLLPFGDRNRDSGAVTVWSDI